MSHSQGRVRTTCQYCGKTLGLNKKYGADQLRKFCSTTCRNFFQSNRKQPDELPRESFTDWVKRVGEAAE
jgi:ribosomal protein L24E